MGKTETMQLATITGYLSVRTNADALELGPDDLAGTIERLMGGGQ